MVKELQRGHDNAVRSPIIRTANGFTNRPIVKLYPLEVNIETDVPVKDPSDVLDATDDCSQDTQLCHDREPQTSHDLNNQQQLRLGYKSQIGLRSCGGPEDVIN